MWTFLTVIAGIIADIIREYRKRKDTVSDENRKLKEEIKRLRFELGKVVKK